MLVTTVMLDFDGEARLDAELFGWVLLTLDLHCVERWTVPTQRGVHTVVEIAEPLDPMAVVALQAILGSDPRRETFNFLRARNLGGAPPFWRDKWNVLYAEKLGRTGAMIDPGEFGSSRPALKPADLGGADAAVLTVQQAETIVVTQDGVERKRLVLTFEQFPDKGYWCNATAVKTLVAKLGPNEVKWAGHDVPLVTAKAMNPTTKKQQDVLWVAAEDEWDEIVHEHSRRSSRRAPAKAKARKR